MKVLELQSIQREEFGLYYRRTFTATVILDLLSKTVEAPIGFIIETSPLGTKTIDVDIDANNLLNYPALPVKTAIKKYIQELDAQGGLP
jgi:hypothetical protein